MISSLVRGLKMKSRLKREEERERERREKANTERNGVRNVGKWNGSNIDNKGNEMSL